MVPDMTAATAPIVLLWKNAPTKGENESASRVKKIPPTMLATAAVFAATSIGSRRWISAAIMPDSVATVPRPAISEPAAS